ncbi:MAG: hypothetical protein RJQ21_02715 [Rhodospirillales bacterium]
MKRFSIFFFIVGFFASGVAFSQEMTFVQSGNGGNCNGCAWVAAQGEITSDTPDIFRKYINEYGRPYLIVFDSPGGSLLSGIELGRLIRETGATTSIGRTVSLSGDLAHLEEIEPGVCVSACAFAFMGGVERWVGNEDSFGVHRFRVTANKSVDSEIVQRLVGISLLYVVEMGVDPAVVILASGTSSEKMYWFEKNELDQYGLDTSGSRVDPWKLEPYKNGLILTTTYRESVRRSIDVRIYCRYGERGTFLLLSEYNEHFARQNTDGILFWRNDLGYDPSLKLGEVTYVFQKENLVFQTLKESTFHVSLKIPYLLIAHEGEKLSFDPRLARVYGSLLNFSVVLPDRQWLSVVANNCIQ